jgi:transposase
MNEKLEISQLEELDRASLTKIILELQELVRQLIAENQSLREQLGKNSRNSSKPPSSDGFKKKTKSLREKGKRTSGGQIGHPGQTLCRVVEPDEIVTHLPEICVHCQTNLGEIAVEQVEKRQVFDIPPQRMTVSEHQVAIKICPCCGQKSKAKFPVGVDHSVQYGENFKAQVAYLSGYQLLPTARLVELIADFYGQNVSEATILEILASLSAAIAPSLEAIESQLLKAEVLHVDETSVRVNGKTQWLHVTSNPALTHYVVHEKRGQQATSSIGLIPEFNGYLVHDAFSSYFVYDQCQHVLCNAHILRELTFLAEEQAQTWAGDLKTLLLQMKREVETAQESGRLEADRLQYLTGQYATILAMGLQAHPPPEKSDTPKRGRVKQSTARNLLLRLEKYQSAVLGFIHDFRVPFDNNLAERDLRMMKLKQKISGGFRTQAGAAIFARLRSYISTVRKQGNDLLDALLSAFLGDPFIPLILLGTE